MLWLPRREWASARALIAHVVNHAVAPPTMKWDVDIAPWELEYGLQKAPVFLPDQRKV